MKKFFLLQIFILLFSTALYCQDEGRDTLLRIEFSGLKKTSESYIQDKVKEFLGKDLNENLIHEIENTLQTEGLFSSIEFQKQEEDEGKVLQVQVKEKISFLILPLFYASSSSFNGGAFILDTNAFGRKDTFIIGGLAGNQSNFLMAAFSKQAKDFFHPGFSLAGTFSNGENIIRNINEEEVFNCDSLRFAFSLSLQEKLNSSWYAGLGAACVYTDISSSSQEIPSGLKSSISTSFGYSTSDWNGYFLSTRLFNIEGSASVTDKNVFNQTASISFSMEQAVTEKVRFLISASAALENGGYATDLFNKSLVKSFVLNSDFSTDKAACVWAGFEKSFFTFSMANISAFFVYEATATEDWDNSFAFCHGPVVGSKVYLKKIAIPAMSLALAYDVPDALFQFAFSLGMNF